MSSTITYEDPPCQLDELMQFTFNYKNMQNYLTSIVNNNREFYLKIVSLTNRLEELDVFRVDLEETNSRIKRCEEKFQQVDNTIHNHQRKLIDLESKAENNFMVK